jgi:hypothetical protein
MAAIIGLVWAVGAFVPGGEKARERATAATQPPARAKGTESETRRAGAKPRTSDKVSRLQAMVPAPIRSSCKPDPSEYSDALARVSCEQWGATFYYSLYRDELEARYSFSISADLANDDARRHAARCRGADEHAPFVGAWRAGQLLCTYDDDIVTIEWTEKGRPIVASLLYSAGDRAAAAEGAELAWQRATG